MTQNRNLLQRQSLSLNTTLLAQRVILTWGQARKEKFFKDLGLGNIWKQHKKTALSGPYLVSDMFDYIHRKRANTIIDVVREIIRTEWYLLEFKRRRMGFMAPTLEELFLQKHPQLVESLKRDGYRLHAGEISPMSIEELQKIKSSLDSKLEKAGFKVASKHYLQAWENYVLGNWEAANAQLRSFLEALFDDFAVRLYPEAAIQENSGGARRKLLQNKGFIESEKASFIKSFFEMAHTKGAHPGLSSEEDCRLRAAVCTQLAGYYLDKYLCT
jgi:hypothetical protein